MEVYVGNVDKGELLVATLPMQLILDNIPGALEDIINDKEAVTLLSFKLFSAVCNKALSDRILSVEDLQELNDIILCATKEKDLFVFTIYDASNENASDEIKSKDNVLFVMQPEVDVHSADEEDEEEPEEDPEEDILVVATYHHSDALLPFLQNFLSVYPNMEECEVYTITKKHKHEYKVLIPIKRKEYEEVKSTIYEFSKNAEVEDYQKVNTDFPIKYHFKEFGKLLGTIKDFKQVWE